MTYGESDVRGVEGWAYVWDWAGEGVVLLRLSALIAGSGVLHSSRQTHVQENDGEVSHLEKLLWQLADEVLHFQSALPGNNLPRSQQHLCCYVGGKVGHTLNLRSKNVNGALRISNGNIPDRRLLEKSTSYRYFKAETSGSVPVKELEFAFVLSASLFCD